MSDEQPLTISQVCSRFPGARGSRHVTPSTVTRWIIKGCPSRTGDRIRLAATRCGGRWLIRSADLDAFFRALAAEPVPPLATPRTPNERDQASQAAERELIRRGA